MVIIYLYFLKYTCIYKIEKSTSQALSIPICLEQMICNEKYIFFQMLILFWNLTFATIILKRYLCAQAADKSI